jgi:hypothetical protein
MEPVAGLKRHMRQRFFGDTEEIRRTSAGSVGALCDVRSTLKSDKHILKSRDPRSLYL